MQHFTSFDYLAFAASILLFFRVGRVGGGAWGGHPGFVFSSGSTGLTSFQETRCHRACLPAFSPNSRLLQEALLSLGSDPGMCSGGKVQFDYCNTGAAPHCCLLVLFCFVLPDVSQLFAECDVCIFS